MIQCKNRMCTYQTIDPWICFRSFKNKERPPNCSYSFQRSGLEGFGDCPLFGFWQLPYFSEKQAKQVLPLALFFPQEEPLYPCSATRHPARGALPPRNQLQPSTCLPSWLPTLTSGPPACVKPMGHTVVSNSSLRPPVSGERRALFWGHISPGHKVSFKRASNKLWQETRQVAPFIFLELPSN